MTCFESVAPKPAVPLKVGNPVLVSIVRPTAGGVRSTLASQVPVFVKRRLSRNTAESSTWSPWSNSARVSVWAPGVTDRLATSAGVVP